MKPYFSISDEQPGMSYSLSVKGKEEPEISVWGWGWPSDSLKEWDPHGVDMQVGPVLIENLSIKDAKKLRRALKRAIIEAEDKAGEEV